MQTFVTSSVRSQDLKNATTKLDILWLRLTGKQARDGEKTAAESK